MKKFYEMNEDGDLCYVNPTTGEVADFDGKVVYIQTEEERLKTREYFKRQNESDTHTKDINENFKEYGNFIWNVYSINQQLFPNLKPSNITRLMLLSTYLNYEGYLMYNKKTLMDKTNMAKLLQLGDRQYRIFYTEMVSSGIFQVSEDNKIYINKDLFGKGHLNKNAIGKFTQDDKYITRLYIHGVRSLYEKSTPLSHKTLSYLFQVMPYVNRQYNIVCFNPLEEDLDKIQSMTLGECCEIIGFNPDHAARLFKYLFEPQFVIDGKVTNAMRYVVNKGLDKSTYSMYINPRVYYAGNKWKDVEILGAF